MKSTALINKILDSSTLASGMFIASGSYKTYKDYKTASPEYKDRFLAKDCVILSGAALGMFAHQAASNKIAASKSYNKVINMLSKKVNESGLKNGFKISLQYTTDIIKDLSSGFISTAAGILGALSADYLLSKTSFEQPKFVEYEIEKDKFSQYLEDNLSKFTDENTRNILYTSVSDLPKIRIFASGMLGADAIELAKNRELDKKLQHTTEYLVNDTLVPLIFLSTSSSLTKHMKAKYRVPIIFLSFFSGMSITQKIMDKIVKNQN